MTEPIRLAVHGGLAHITLDRPARLNAIDFEMGDFLRDVATYVTSAAGVGAILLDAHGPAFCSGGDVLAMAGTGATGADVTRAAVTINEAIQTFVLSPIPIVASVRGAVAGGGIGIMLLADYIVAGPDLKVVGKYADVGLTPDLGVSTLLPATVGQRRALELLMTDRQLDAAEALEWGMVAEVADDPDTRAREIATHWLTGATAAYGHAKRLVREGAHRPFAASLADEAATIGAAFETHAAQERIAAFAKRSVERR